MYGAGGQKRVPDYFVRNFAIGFPPTLRAIDHRRLPRPRNRQDRRADCRTATADRTAQGKAASGHFPRRHQRPQPRCADEGFRHRMAGRSAGALGG